MTTSLKLNSAHVIFPQCSEQARGERVTLSRQLNNRHYFKINEEEPGYLQLCAHVLCMPYFGDI